MTKNLDFVIAGAQKGGSTQLAAHLQSVKGVWIPAEECTAFESPYYEAEAVQSLRYKIALNCEDYCAAGIKRPSYLGIEGIPERIKYEFPSVKIVLVLRDPVDRAVSAYLHKAQYGRIQLKPVSEALTALLAGEDLGSQRSYEILHWSRYSLLLPRWRRVFDTRLHILGSGDLRADGAASVGRVTDFLGVDYDLDEPVPKQSNVGAKSMTELRLRRHEKKAIVRVEPSTLRMLPRTNNPLRLACGAGFRLASQVMNRTTEARSAQLQLDPSVRERLVEYFAEDYLYVKENFHVHL